MSLLVYLFIPFFVLTLLLYFCLFVNHVNKFIIFVFETFVYYFKNTISIYVIVCMYSYKIHFIYKKSLHYHSISCNISCNFKAFKSSRIITQQGNCVSRKLRLKDALNRNHPDIKTKYKNYSSAISFQEISNRNFKIVMKNFLKNLSFKVDFKL